LPEFLFPTLKLLALLDVLRRNVETSSLLPKSQRNSRDLAGQGKTSHLGLRSLSQQAGVADAGTQMGFLDWTKAFNTTTQTLTTVIGETYTISYFVAGTHSNFLEVTFGGLTLFNGTSPTNGVGSPSDCVACCIWI